MSDPLNLLGGDALETARLRLVLPTESMAEALCEYLVRNQDHFAASSPLAAQVPTTASCRLSIANARNEAETGRGLRLYIVRTDQTTLPIGEVSFTNIIGGPFQACHLGYRIDREHEGQRLMTEALQPAIAYVFTTLGLHRIMANYVPTNERSGRLLRTLGFSVEGYARDYLKLAGRWADHVLTSLVRVES